MQSDHRAGALINCGVGRDLVRIVALTALISTNVAKAANKRSTDDGVNYDLSCITLS